MAMVRAVAKVTLTVEVSTQSTWSMDCSVEEIRKATTEEAINILVKCIHSGAIKARVTGTPSVSVITANLRMDLYCAQQVYEALGKIIAEQTSPASKDSVN